DQDLLTWDHDARKLVKREAYTTDITYLPDDLETNDLLKDLRNQSNEVLNKKVTELNQSLKADWHHETPLMQKLTDDMKEETSADIVLLNSGLMLEDFDA